MPLDNDNALIGDWNAASAGDSNNPPGGDKRNQGDDQIRRAKGTIRRHFPGFVGTWASPKVVNASEDEINTLVGISQTDPIITLPSGAIALFEVNTLPGWTKVTSPAYNNIGIRINTGTITDTTYGTLDFDVCFSRSETDGHALIDAELPSTDFNHGHGSALRDGPGQVGTNDSFLNQDQSIFRDSGPLAATSTNIVNDSTGLTFGSDSPHTHGNDIQLRYRDFCAFQKD